MALPGADIGRVLVAVLSLLPLNQQVATPAQIMQAVGDPDAEPAVFGVFKHCLAEAGSPAAEAIERFAFYAASAEAFAVVQTGERRLYGNIILRTGVIE